MNEKTEKKLQLIYTLRQAGITDSKVLKSIENTDRSLFLSDAFKERSIENIPLPISCGQTISQPTVVAKMMQLLDLNPKDKILEIGTGSGYQAVLLSKLVRRVYTVERKAFLAKEAHSLISEMGIGNITVIKADGALGLPIQAPFDKILITAAAEEVPKILLDQLKIGGLMVAPIGPVDDYQFLTKVTKKVHGCDFQEYEEVKFVPLLEDTE
ncbi:MAG: protein-L-isoaspartate O-methyltransferase [Rhodobacterales bacterium]|nr:protein-L-isoaspartate O-methyltransferase [Rhodobacterales bacterium]